MTAHAPLSTETDDVVSWDDIFMRIDAAKQQAAEDPVGKLRALKAVPRLETQSRPSSARETKSKHHMTTERPMSSRQNERHADLASDVRNRTKHVRAKARGFRLAVRHADLFDTNIGMLHHKNFGTWDQNRCHLPERLWPCQGAIGTLYDAQRKDKVEWRRGMPRGRDFGMALADVGTGTAAEAFVAKYVRKQRQAWSEQEHSPDDRSGVAVDDSLHSGRRTTVRWVGGRPVQLEFG